MKMQSANSTIRVQIAPKRSPRYVSVVLDTRQGRRGKIHTLHSFGRDSLLARVQADLFRAECLLAEQYLRQAVTEDDRQAILQIFEPLLGRATLETLFPDLVLAQPLQTDWPYALDLNKHVARRRLH